MPTLCVLNGIAIRMNTRDHPLPHFHAYFGEHQVRIEIANLAVMTGHPNFGVISWPNGADVDAELLRYDDLWGQAVPLARPA